MKDVALYVFLFCIYAVLALHLFALADHGATYLNWQTLGAIFLLFAGAATLARWTVLAFKPRPEQLLAGQKIVGIEIGEGESVMDVVKPQKLKREDKKPKLKRRSRF